MDFNDVALKCISHSGITDIVIISCLKALPWTLAHLMDFVLLISGFSFPALNADQELSNPAVATMPDHVHIMPAMPETSANMATTPELRHVIAAMPETR